MVAQLIARPVGEPSKLFSTINPQLGAHDTKCLQKMNTTGFEPVTPTMSKMESLCSKALRGIGYRVFLIWPSTLRVRYPSVPDLSAAIGQLRYAPISHRVVFI